MPGPKRLVLFVEGDGDEASAPVLLNHLFTECAAWDCLFLDPAPFHVGAVYNLLCRDGEKWRRWLGAARKNKNFGGVLLFLDGDVRARRQESFCAAKLARELSSIARTEGAGQVFSVATVFALREYESWLIAGVESLAGKLLPDGRPGVRAGTLAEPGDLEAAPRDAKGWLNRHMESGYKPTTDQGPLTSLLVEDLGPLRTRCLRSLRRLENAVRLLTEAFRSGNHIVTPEQPASAPK
jgi:hypothetical protein